MHILYITFKLPFVCKSGETPTITTKTNALFLQSHTLKFIELVKFKRALIMCKARNNLLLEKNGKIFVWKGRVGIT